MANETLINDVVAREAMQQLEELDRAMVGTLQQYKDCASELAKGLKIPVEVTGDVERLKELTNTVMRDAQQATQQLTQQLQQQQQVVANTTNTISRQLQAQENLNKAQREAFTQDQQAQDLAKALLGTRQQNYELLARYTAEMKANKDAQKQVNEQEKQGLITAEQAIQKRATLMAAYDKTKFAAQELTKILAAENKESNAVQGSYQQLSQKLERLKMAYKQMNDAQKASAGGKELEKEIQNLDAHLKDLAADMGEHQRNVGNYAIASQSLKSELKDLTNEIAQLTMEYNHLSSEEQRNDVGIALREKIAELTEKAGEYRDIIADVKQSISASASDTRWFDTMAESGQLMISTFQLAQSSCEALGLSEKSLQQSMLGVQRAMQAVQALQVIQNTLQKQSNLMKGIGIIQTKALAAATALETKARTQETGATIAQTVAMKAFNAVAKANPYVLLATAILAVIGLIVGYTAATKDATEADEAAKAAAEERKNAEDSLYQAMGQNAGELLTKYKLLRTQWNAFGDDIAAKRQYLVQHKDDFRSLAEAVGLSEDSYKDVTSVEKNFVNNGSAVESAIRRRAKAMAYYAEYIKAVQKEIEILEKMSSPQSYKAGQRISAGEAANLKKYGYNPTWVSNDANSPGSNGAAFMPSSAAVRNYSNNGYWEIGDAAAANRAAAASWKAALDESLKPIKDWQDKLWAGFVDNGGLEQAKFSGGGGGGKNKPTKKTGGSSNKRGGGTDKSESVKEAEDIKAEIDAIILQAVKGQVDAAKEGTDEWAKYQREALKGQADADKAAVEEKRIKTLEELKKTHAAGKMSEEEYNQQVNYLNEASRQVRLNIEKKLAKDLMEVNEEVANYKIGLLAEENEEVVEKINTETANYLSLVNRRYQGELALAKGNAEEIERIRKDHASEIERIEAESAMRVAQATIDSLEKQVAMENISDEERKKIAKELADTKRSLEDMTTEMIEKNLDEQVEAEKEAAEKQKEIEDQRRELIEKWVDTIADGISKVADLMSAMYDNQISKVEQLIEEEQQRYDAEVNHIDWLADRGAITTEEAEIRKRDAAERTAKAQEALEKKKSALEYKKAIVEKANSVAQAIIATSLAVTKALPNIPLSILVGALGAAQVTTILKQPIKAYAEGTKGKPHPGGPAVVGDAGRSELVMFGHRAWVTPDTPTVVDLPKGAEVMPDASKVDLVQMGADLAVSLPRGKGGNSPVIINDYQALESRMANNTKAVTQTLNRFERNVTRQMRRQKFNAYISQRI